MALELTILAAAEDKAAVVEYGIRRIPASSADIPDKAWNLCGSETVTTLKGTPTTNVVLKGVNICVRLDNVLEK